VRRRFTIILLLAMLLVCLPAAVTHPPALAGAGGEQPPSGQIAYIGVSEDDTASQEVWVANSDGSKAHRIAADLGFVRDLQWSPNGEWLAVAAAKTTGESTSVWLVWLMHGDGSALHPVDLDLPGATAGGQAAGRTELNSIAWSPDGRRLALAYVAYDDGAQTGTTWILLLDVRSGDLSTLAGPGDIYQVRMYGELSWRPDGAQLAASMFSITGESATLDLVDAQTGETLREGVAQIDDQTSSYPYVTAPAYSPDGSRLACLQTSLDMEAGEFTMSRLAIVPSGEDRVIVVAEAKDGTLFDRPSWSPDGGWLASGRSSGRRSRIVLFSAENGGREIDIALTGRHPVWQPLPSGSPASSYPTQASLYGADYGAGDIDSRTSPTVAAGYLKPVGFKATVHRNDSAESALKRLAGDEIFYFDGHGNWDIISFAGPGGGSRSALMTSSNHNYKHIERYVDLGGTDLWQLDLAVFNSCDAGLNAHEDGNLLRSFVANGCLCAIGFDTTVTASAGDRWAESFFRYACKEGLEVGAAATKAAADSSTRTLFFWGEDGISPSSVVVKRRVTGKLYIDDSPPRYVGDGLPEY
jgi:Tol biopolymer transport system component